MRQLPGRGHAPVSLSRNGPAAVTALHKQILSGAKKLKFRTSLYGGKAVRNKLTDLHASTCAYCEADLRPVTVGHIDHFRPKAGYTDQNTGNLVKPGYYKLSYSWKNLLLACDICNGTYKKNLFPIISEVNRNINCDDLDSECCLLINPFDLNPRDHIRFRGNIPYPVGGSMMGKKTIEVVGLNRNDLNDAREKTLRAVRIAYLLMTSFPPGSEKHDIGKKAYDIMTASNAPFSSCIKDFVESGYRAY